MPATPRSLRHFSILWIGQLASSIGSGISAFGLAAYLFERTGTATSVTLVTLCAFLPPILLAPFAGVLADRFDRRLLMIAGDGLSALGLIYILVSAISGQIAPWQIYVGVLASSLFSTLLDPAYRATITDLVPADQYDRASGMVQLAGSAKYLISPVIAGAVYQFSGVVGVLLIDISTFLVTAATTLAVRRLLLTTRQGETADAKHRNRLSSHSLSHWVSDFAQGWRELSERRGVMTVIGVMAFATFCIGFLETLFPPLLLSFTTTQTLGIVETVSAVGLLAGSLLVSLVKITKKYHTELLLGLASAGVCIVGIGLTQNPFIIAAAGFCFFLSLPFVNTPAEVMLRRAIPNEAQGRAWGLISLLTNIGFVAAYATAGPIADSVFTPLLMPDGALATTVGAVFGVGPGRGIGVMLAVAGCMLLVSAVALARNRSLRIAALV